MVTVIDASGLKCLACIWLIISTQNVYNHVLFSVLRQNLVTITVLTYVAMRMDDWHREYLATEILEKNEHNDFLVTS